ncbi:MAG TPA: bifunctional enoyl-CoA hydratase/phosphate acetyltransferase [Casimicrobiaceae bacterium]|nr:bifunctional enoyl-CoA hydratase/phosphate acetyltransferase [Casimicrobiaceae bacterium]
MAVRPQFQRLVERVRMRPPLAAAIVYPCDRDSLQTALSGAFAGYLEPILVGPEGRIRDTALRAGLDISRLPIVDTADDPRAAGQRAAEVVRDGKVAALVKGSMSDGDLLAPVAASESGLRTERRLSHASFLDLPGRPNGMLVADAQLNIAPNLAAKKDIVANTVELAHALGVSVPSVALLAAMDYVTPAFASTADAAALKSMAEQGLFGKTACEGPLTADTALSAEAARANGVKSDLAGHPDVLIAPSMEAASLLLRTLTGLTGGLAAGIVLGARIPIVVPARTDSMEVRMASCVLASLIVAARAPASGTEVKPVTAARPAETARAAA